MTKVFLDDNNTFRKEIITDLDLQQVYLSVPWKRADYRLFNSDYYFLADFDEKSVRSMAMAQGHRFKLINICKRDGIICYEFKLRENK